MAVALVFWLGGRSPGLPLIAEHDPDRRWVVVGSEHGTVTLDDGAWFFG